MASFYWEDYGQKKCSVMGKLCDGPTCTVFCWLNKYYAFCGHEPEPKAGDLAHRPLGFGAGNFTWRTYTEGLMPVKDLPKPPPEKAPHPAATK
jgi:hypothetical protein